jgi:hypothetical protein
VTGYLRAAPSSETVHFVEVYNENIGVFREIFTPTLRIEKKRFAS